MYTQVTTADGYILSLKRIPRGRGGGGGGARAGQPVLLQHGVLVVRSRAWLLILFPPLSCQFHVPSTLSKQAGVSSSFG